MVYQRGRIVTVIEYDGDEHYRQSIKIKSDRVKDEMAKVPQCTIPDAW
jgi:hypothetical protein